MIRLSLLVLSIFSLIYGVYFLFFPFNFVSITAAEQINIAWLRKAVDLDSIKSNYLKPLQLAAREIVKKYIAVSGED